MPRSTVTWQPILAGESLARARGELEELTAFLRTRAPDSIPSLSRGHAGFSLLWTYLGLPNADPDAFSRARAHLETAVAALETETMRPFFYGGFTGVAWVQLHVERRLFGLSDVDSCDEIDDALIQLLEASPWAHDFDLVSGLAGFGVYWLEREPRGRARQGLELLLDRLIECSTRARGGVYWHTPARLLNVRVRSAHPDGYTSLGVAHGVAGVLPILAGMISRGAGGERARALLDDAFAWLMSQRLSSDAPASFPNFAFESNAGELSRVAWCYGDAGMAAVLDAAAQAAGHDEMRAAALAIGLKAAARDLHTSGVRDAGLCHGSAGVAHVFNRLFQSTGDERFRDASQEWLMAALASKRPRGAATPFPMWDPDFAEGSGWRPEMGLLEGAGGVALAIHAAISDVEPNWDRFLLLSIPEAGSFGRTEPRGATGSKPALH